MSVHGWLEDHESRWLAENAYNKSLVIEFGSWCGKSALALSCAKRLVCVDTWLGTPGDCGGHESLIAEGLSPIAEWRANTKHLPNVIGIAGNLRDPEVEGLLKAAYGGKADLVFIDAAHDVESVTRDIWLAKALLSRNGILCGHDYSDAHPGVKAAVKTMIPHARTPAGTIWTAS